jgi:tetratricopeptide (TPR) repeat protein
LQRQQNQQAVDVLERALAQHAGDRYALQLLGTAYRRLGRVDEAEYALAIGSSGEPAWPDPWTDEMLQYRRGFAVRLKDATAYFSAGQLALSISLLEQLRQERPDDIALLNHLGEVYVAAGRTAEGVRLLEQVVARDPERFEAYVNLASGYLNENDLMRATAAIDRGIALNPRLGRAHETRGLILWRRDDERGAVQAFRDAVRYDPRDVRAYVWKGMVEMNLGRPADAVDSFAHAVHLDPTRVDAWVGIADATMNVGAWDRAAVAVQRALQLNPNAPAVKRRRACRAADADLSSPHHRASGSHSFRPFVVAHATAVFRRLQGRAAWSGIAPPRPRPRFPHPSQRCSCWRGRRADDEFHHQAINGKVTDKTNAVLPGVTVTISSPPMMGAQYGDRGRRVLPFRRGAAGRLRGRIRAGGFTR